MCFIFYFQILQVEKQSAHFYSIELTEREAQAGVVCRVYSSQKSKFKVISNSQIIHQKNDSYAILIACFVAGIMYMHIYVDIYQPMRV